LHTYYSAEIDKAEVEDILELTKPWVELLNNKLKEFQKSNGTVPLRLNYNNLPNVNNDSKAEDYDKDDHSKKQAFKMNIDSNESNYRGVQLLQIN
jgi:hypothetical protein